MSDCIDPCCPCQDGDPCHYDDGEGTPAEQYAAGLRSEIERLNDVTLIMVVYCSDCPFNYDGVYCQHVGGRDGHLAPEDFEVVIPEWCPLKKKAVRVEIAGDAR